MLYQLIHSLLGFPTLLKPFYRWNNQATFDVRTARLSRRLWLITILTYSWHLIRGSQVGLPAATVDMHPVEFASRHWITPPPLPPTKKRNLLLNKEKKNKSTFFGNATNLVHTNTFCLKHDWLLFDLSRIWHPSSWNVWC